jgi:hypothetical protein
VILGGSGKYLADYLIKFKERKLIWVVNKNEKFHRNFFQYVKSSKILLQTKTEYTIAQDVAEKNGTRTERKFRTVPKVKIRTTGEIKWIFCFKRVPFLCRTLYKSNFLF